MTTDSLSVTTPAFDAALEGWARRSAQAAAGLTVVGVATLSTFFAVGEPWGTINDLSAIALAGATVPVAVGLARRNPGSTALALGVGLDVVGAVTTSAFTTLLIARRMTFDESLLGVLAGQALIGGWLILVGVTAWPDPAARRLATLSVAGGAGLVATAVGIATGGMTSPLAFAGFAAGIVGTIGTYTLLGWRSRR